MIIILSILCVTFYIIGVFILTLLMDWDINKVTDLLKILTWPISFFLEK
jgi:hypothetical protein